MEEGDGGGAQCFEIGESWVQFCAWHYMLCNLIQFEFCHGKDTSSQWQFIFNRWKKHSETKTLKIVCQIVPLAPNKKLSPIVRVEDDGIQDCLKNLDEVSIFEQG